MRARSEAGASAVEYGLLVALIAGVIVSAVLALGQTNSGSLQNSCEEISTTMGSTC